MEWVIKHERDGEADHPGPSFELEVDRSENDCCKSDYSFDEDRPLALWDDESEEEFNVDIGDVSDESDSEDDRPRYKALRNKLPFGHQFYLLEVTKRKRNRANVEKVDNMVD